MTNQELRELMWTWESDHTSEKRVLSHAILRLLAENKLLKRELETLKEQQ